MILSSVPLYLVPLVAALGAAVLLLGDFAQRARIGLVSLGGSLALLFAASVPLFRHETPFTIGPRVARMGSLDATLILSLTPVTALLAGAVILGGLMVLATPARSTRTRASEAAIAGLAAAVTLGALANGYPALLTGTLGFGLMLAALVGTDTQKGAGRVLAGVMLASVALSLSSAVLFWGLGGKFLDGRRFLSDFRPRFVAVSDTPESPPPQQSPHARGDVTDLNPNATGYLTMTSHPGARVYLSIADEGQLTGRPPDAVSPFVSFPVRAGVQKIAIDPGGGALIGGDGQEIALVDDVRIATGSHVTIEAVGPTVTFSEIQGQLQKEESAIETRKLGPLRLLDAARAAIGLALLALALAVGSAGGSARARALGGLGAVVLAGTIRDRLGALVGEAGAAPVLAGLATACVALGCAFVAARASSPGALAARASGWIVATTALALPFGAPAGAGVAAAGAALALVATALVLDGTGDAILRGAPKLDLVLRPAVVAAFAATVITASIIAFGAAVRGGIGGVSTAVLEITAAFLFVFAFFRAFFALRRDPNASSTRPAKDGTAKRKKRKAAKPSEHEVSGATARVVATLSATAIVLAVLGGWLAKGTAAGHGVIGLAIAAVIVIGAAGAAIRARSVASSETFLTVAEREARGPLGRIAEGNDSAKPTGPANLAARIVLGIDALFAWPLAALSRAGGGTSSDEERGAS